MKKLDEPIVEGPNGARYQERSAFGRSMHFLGGIIKGVIRGGVLGALGWAAAACLTTAALGPGMFLAAVALAAAAGAGVYGNRALHETPGHGHTPPMIKKPDASKGPEPYQPYNSDIIHDREVERHAIIEHEHHRRQNFLDQENARRRQATVGEEHHHHHHL